MIARLLAGFAFRKILIVAVPMILAGGGLFIKYVIDSKIDAETELAVARQSLRGANFALEAKTLELATTMRLLDETKKEAKIISEQWNSVRDKLDELDEEEIVVWLRTGVPPDIIRVLQSGEDSLPAD